MNREEQKQTIKDYLKRLGAGEELESVRVDFVKKFQSVDAAEIMNAEQELIKEGTPISEVQRLCDVHSALFHGKTREEQIANAPKATVDSIREQRFAKTAELVKIPGHPLHTFTLENEALAKTIEKCREALKNGHVEHKLIEEVRQLAIHYAKKGDLLYPHLKVKYETAVRRMLCGRWMMRYGMNLLRWRKKRIHRMMSGKNVSRRHSQERTR